MSTVSRSAEFTSLNVLSDTLLYLCGNRRMTFHRSSGVQTDRRRDIFTCIYARQGDGFNDDSAQTSVVYFSIILLSIVA
jgi:hypothetical protein